MDLNFLIKFERFFKEEEGQTALEYLLIVGGIMLLVLIVLMVVQEVLQSGGKRIGDETSAYNETVYDVVE
ncbi:MAG: Flp family type IVb pilin [Candidatus Micrarchaeia archaeon]